MNDINHGIRAHAKLSASKVASVALCHGKLNAEAAMPDEPSGDAAARGTAIHELAEALYEGSAIPDDAPADLLDVAQKYVDTLKTQTQSCKRSIIEMDVTQALQTIHPDLGGTADFVGIGGGALTVVDLKTGRVDVDPQYNLQLMTYALGAAIALKAPAGIKVRLAIYQPESGGWKEWGCSYADLMDWRESLKELANSASHPLAPRTPGAEQCRYCKAKAVCPELRAKATDKARQEFAPDALIAGVTPEMLDDAELAITWAEAVQDAAKKQLAADPIAIKGWKLKDGRKMLKWKDGAMARALLDGKMDCWDLKSPSAVQKLGIELPEGLVEESRAASSLSKVKA